MLCHDLEQAMQISRNTFYDFSVVLRVVLEIHIVDLSIVTGKQIGRAHV